MIIQHKRYSSLVELEADATQIIEASALGYYQSGAESEATLRRNTTQFFDYSFRPRCLVDVSEATTSSSILGGRVRMSMPVMVAPMAMQRLANAAEGERGMARGARGAGVPMVLSTMSTTSMEEVVGEVGCEHMLFQLYCLKDREVTRKMISRAERLRFQGIVVTVDAPVLGKREMDEQSQFSLPRGLELSILKEEGLVLSRGDEDEHTGVRLESNFGSTFGSLIDDSLDWSVISFIRCGFYSCLLSLAPVLSAPHLTVPLPGGSPLRLAAPFSPSLSRNRLSTYNVTLRSITNLPIILKGVLSVEDAKLAVKHGVDAIVVSNHGGRQLDHCIGSLDVLEEVSKAVRGRCEVWLDGGVRRGTDVVKALALGADAVLVGRPMLWALALGGGKGVEAALKELQQDVLRTMKLLGVSSCGELRRKKSKGLLVKTSSSCLARR